MLTEALVAVVAGVLVVKYLTRKKYNLPPGPKGLPFIGNVFQLDKTATHNTMTEWSEEYGDVFKIKVSLQIRAKYVVKARTLQTNKTLLQEALG